MSVQLRNKNKNRNKRRNKRNNNNNAQQVKMNVNPQRNQIIRQPRSRPLTLTNLVKEFIPSALGVAGPIVTRSLMKLITGFGEYRIAGNSLMSGTSGIDPPEVRNTPGGMVVRHREYLGDINATTTFTLQSFNINPGLRTTFPWLSSVAQSFEQYRIQGMIFEFKSLASDAVLSTSTSSALGSVIMATQYDALDTAFTSKFNMENYQFACSSKPSISFIHPIECARNQTSISELYIRNGAVSGDLRLYDLGVFNIATVGMQASSGVCGELWLTYEVQLFKPKLIEDLGLEVYTDHFNLKSVTNSTPLGTTSTLAAGSTMGGVITSGYLYNFPPNIVDGNYLFTWNVTGNSTAISLSAITFTRAVGYQIFQSDASSNVSNTVTTTTNALVIGAVQITSSGATISFGTGGTLPATITSGDLIVTQIPAGIS